MLPGIQFDLKRVQSEGPPWRTLVTVEWSETNWGTDGVQTSAEGINVIQLRWGRVTSVHIYVDTERLVGTLKRIAQKGTEEAMASPIIS